MSTKKTKKLVSSILLICIVISNLSSVFAVNIGDTADLVFLKKCGYYITYERDGVSLATTTSLVGFYDNGTFHPAYCVNKELPGVEEDRHYGVVVEDMNSLVNNQAIWRVLINGYPYKTPQQMGLENDEQAYMVTKQAIYRVIDGESTSNYGYLNDAGKVMVAKIKELVNIGLNGTQTYQDPVINVSKVTNAGVDSKNSNYISQSYRVDSQVDMKNIEALLNSSSAPEGTFIADENNKAKTTFNKGDILKILVPRKNIKSDINIQVSLNGSCKAYPILFGRSPSSDLQNYCLTTDPYVTSAAKLTMSYSPSVDITINKISNGDSQITGIKDGEGIDGTPFNVKSEDGSYNKNFTTANGGKIEIKDLKIQKYIITELEAADYYLMGKDTTAIVDPKYDGDDKTVTIENTPVKIEVNVEKDADKDEAQGNEILTYEIDNIKNLSNVKLNNFTLTDDLPKEVRIQNLETGIYNEDLKYSVTYNTNKKSNIKLQDNLSTKKNNIVDFTKIKLADGEYVTSYSINFGTVNIGFANKTKMKVATKVVTGLVDKSTFINNVKVGGSYLEATTEDKDDKEVEVYENILKIRKFTKEYNQYTEFEAGTRINAVFELLDENKNYIATFNVKASEDYIHKYLETGKTYYLKEISTDPYYVIREDLIEFKFEKNGQVLELEIDNENVNLVVDVEKEGPTEAEKGEVIIYDFNNIGNFSNTEVNEFVWGDKMPRQVRIQTLETGTWNQELTYKIQYITNKNTNWKDIGEYSTTENNKIDFTQIEVAEGEYVKEFRVIFGKVKSGFTHVESPKVTAKVNEDVQDNKIFVNKTYVTASYQETKLGADDDAHTVVYTKELPTDKELPKTGLDY